MVAKLDHKTWAKQFYAGARQAAYDEIKPQYDAKWKDLRANTPRSERNEAAATLKAEQKEAYAAVAKRQIDLRRPEKDSAWKALRRAMQRKAGPGNDAPWRASRPARARKTTCFAAASISATLSPR